MIQDLVIVVADKQMEFAVAAALERPESLRIRPISYAIRVHPNRDAGVRTSGAAILATERPRFEHGLLMLDFEGAGATEAGAASLEADLIATLRMKWGDAASAVVIEPELDVWMWGSDNSLRQVLGWPHAEAVRQWVTNRGFIIGNTGKPLRPKEALEAVLRECRIARSASVYQKIVRQVSIARCADPAALRLGEMLRRWFGVDGDRPR